jgi:hypothetical protein
MHRFGILAVSGLVAVGALAAGQSAPPASSSPAVRGHKGAAEMESVTGTVKKYSEGKSIVIVGADGRGRKLVLDGTTRIEGPVKKGQAVTAVWMTDDSGRPHVHAISAYPKGGSENTAALESPEPTPRETAVAPTATPHGPAEDATTPSVRRTPVPGAP